MKLRYEIQANTGNEARRTAESRARAEGWKTITGTYVYPTGDVYSYVVEVFAQ